MKSEAEIRAVMEFAHRILHSCEEIDAATTPPGLSRAQLLLHAIGKFGESRQREASTWNDIAGTLEWVLEAGDGLETLVEDYLERYGYEPGAAK